jgi:hypothetical protein
MTKGQREAAGWFADLLRGKLQRGRARVCKGSGLPAWPFFFLPYFIALVFGTPN